MHAASLLNDDIAERGAPRESASVAAESFQVALVSDGATAETSSLGLGRAAASLEDASVPPRWEEYWAAFERARIQYVASSCLDELRRRIALEPNPRWVVVVDPANLCVDELTRLLAMRRPEQAPAAPRQFIALCAHTTSPQKLRRLFEAGAYLSERNVTPHALLRLCRLAGQGARAPLTRFSDRARLSRAEQRAFFAECAGLSKCEAADELGCSQRTIETYWSRIFAKLGIRSTDGVVAAALRFAMLDSEAAEA